MSDYFLLIFPITIFVILFAGARVSRKGGFSEAAWGLTQAKAMRGFAALMVVLHHLVQTITDCTNVKKGPITIWNSFGLLFTSIFFFFSGYGLYKNYRSKENYLDGFLRKRLPRLLIPVLLVNALYLFTISWHRISGVGTFLTSITGFTLMNTNSWFVVELILLYIAFYIFFRTSGTERAAIVKLGCFTAVMVIFALLLGHDRSHVRGHWFMGEWWYNSTPIFMLGMVVAKNEERVKSFMKKWYRLLLPGMIIFLTGWYILEQYVSGHVGYYKEWSGHPGYPEKLLTLLVQVVLCAGFVILLLLINLKVEYHNPVLSFISGISFEIYLIHGLFRELFPGEPGSSWPDALYMVAVYACSVAAAWLMSLIGKYVRTHLRKKAE